MKISEYEIRPETIFNEYLSLTKKDIEFFFNNVEKNEIDCPVCNIKGETWVSKEGFSYKKCTMCFSIFVSPRPSRDAFDAYYKDSLSTEYWATTFYKVTESARREKLWKPKAQLIKQRIEKFQGDKNIKYIIDIGGGYGVFDEEIRKIMEIEPIVVEPSIHLAKICRDKGIEVFEKFMEDMMPGEFPSGGKCFVSFELFEHLHDPISFLQSVLNAMTKDDIFIFTTLSGMGLDIQVLGEHAKSLSPPHHLNFLNPKSITTLLGKVGFDVLEAITPGKLDIDILVNNKGFINDFFWKNILSYSSEKELELIQQFISNIGLSSHMMISCCKR